MRRALELHWPALLVASACVGLALSIWIPVPLVAAAAVAVGCLGAVLGLDGHARIAALAVAIGVLGLAWGSLRMDALRESVLIRDLGETGVAEVVTVAPARPSPWSTRVIAVARSFRHAQVRERVLLVLPVGRSPPRGSHPRGVRPDHRAAAGGGRLRRAGVARASGHPRRARSVELA